MPSEAVKEHEAMRFGQDFELDLRAYQVRRPGRVLKLERIPMELLLFLVEQRGELVTREQIVARILVCLLKISSELNLWDLTGFSRQIEIEHPGVTSIKAHTSVLNAVSKRRNMKRFVSRAVFGMFVSSLTLYGALGGTQQADSAAKAQKSHPEWMNPDRQLDRMSQALNLTDACRPS